MEFDAVSKKIIGSAIEVHKLLGPGLLESAYEECMMFELTKQGLSVERQKPIPVIYKEIKLDCGYRLDLLVEKSIISCFLRSAAVAGRPPPSPRGEGA